MQSFRSFLMQEAIEGKLMDGTVVYRDPDPANVEEIITRSVSDNRGRANQLRGFLGKNGHVYVWSEAGPIHSKTAQELNIPVEIPFYVKIANGKPEVSIAWSYMTRVFDTSQAQITLYSNRWIKVMLGFVPAVVP